MSDLNDLSFPSIVVMGTLVGGLTLMAIAFGLRFAVFPVDVPLSNGAMILGGAVITMMIFYVTVLSVKLLAGYEEYKEAKR